MLRLPPADEYEITADSWPLITSIDTKKRLYDECLYFREGINAFLSTGLSLRDDLRGFATMIVRPEIFLMGAVPILKRELHRHGFSIAMAHALSMSRLTARELWRYQWTGATLERVTLLDGYLGLGPSCWLLLRDDSTAPMVPAIVRLAALKGSRSPRSRASQSLRGRLATPNKLATGIHIPDEPADILRELGVLFDEATRTRLLDSWAAAARGQAAEDADRPLDDTAVNPLWRDPTIAGSFAELNSISEALDGDHVVRRAVLQDPGLDPWLDQGALASQA